MENYSYPSYPDSGDSSPRSREIEFENPPPWDDPQQPPPNYKAKFMCSYGGKIQPRSHDNQLSYVGGETKILAVDLNTKFTATIAKLSALCGCENPNDLSFKYQLPGEDLDALISVTNDDDLDHMMHEYDRLYRASARPARMRLFLFQATTNANNTNNSSITNSNSSNSLQSEGFVDPTRSEPVKPNPNVDFLFGLEKSAAPVVPPPPQQPVAVKFHDPVPEPVAPPPPLPEYHPRVVTSPTDRGVGSDPNLSHPLEVQRQLQRLQIAEAEQAAYRRKSEDGIAGNFAGGGEYYAQKLPPASNFPGSAAHHAGYWPEKHVSGEVYSQGFSSAAGGGESPVYVIPHPGAFYHAPVMRPAAPPTTTQGYYAVHRMASDGYREAPVYGGVPPPKAPFSSGAPTTLPPAHQVKGPTYTEGFGVVRSVGIPDNTGAAFAQVAYDSSGSGRQVYYTTPGGGMVHAPPYQGVAQTVPGDIRPSGVSLGQDGKVISKVSQGSV